MPEPAVAPAAPAPLIGGTIPPPKTQSSGFSDNPEFMKGLEETKRRAEEAKRDPKGRFASSSDKEPAETKEGHVEKEDPKDRQEPGQEEPKDRRSEAKSAKESVEPSHEDSVAEPYVPGKMKSRDWDNLKTKKDTEINALKAEVARLKIGGEPTELQKVREELAAYQKELREVAAERDPEFRKQWNAETKEAHDRLKAVAPDKLGPKLIAIAELPEGEHRTKLMSDMIGELPPWQQAQIGAAMMDVYRLSDKKSGLIRQTQAKLDEQARLRQEKENEEIEEHVKRQVAIFEEESKQWEAGLKDASGNNAKEVANALSVARKGFNDEIQDPRERSRFALWAGIGPLLARALRGRDEAIAAKDEEIAKLQEQVAILNGSQPAHMGTSPAELAAEDADERPVVIPKGKTGGQVLAEGAVKLGLLRG